MEAFMKTRFSTRNDCRAKHRRYLVRIMFPALAAVMFAALSAPLLFAQEDESGETSPMEVYYLAKSIDDSLVFRYEIKTPFERKRISENLKIRDAFQILLTVAEEYNHIYGNPIDQDFLNNARQINILQISPSHLFEILDRMRVHLETTGYFIRDAGFHTPKTASDITHMLRRISFHLVIIAGRLEIETNWSTPEHVYDAIMRDILPVVYGMADQAGYDYQDYGFPLQPVRGVTPRNITRLLQQIYKNIADYYAKTQGYDPLILVEVNDCDTITPLDSFDLIRVIGAELEALGGTHRLSTDITGAYAGWKSTKEAIGPGDVFRILQHNYILTKRIIEKQG